jgi:large subunit ribosomal protein L5
MLKNQFLYNKFIPTYEDHFFNYKLNYCTKFNINNINSITKCNKIFLNFGFKEIKFEKKQMILYFFLLELISSQKCILTTSRKNLINLKIKRGSVTGCKVTLQNEHLYLFLTNLLWGLPRAEMFKGFSIKKETTLFINSFSTKLKNLFAFYSVESDVLNTVKFLDITFTFNTLNMFDKCFFFTHHKIPLNYI